MNYSAVWAPRAEKDLEKLGQERPLLVGFVLNQIDRPCRDPVGLSRRGGFPFLYSQRYEFEAQNERMRFFVFFAYGADEVTLLIEATVPALPASIGATGAVVTIPCAVPHALPRATHLPGRSKRWNLCPSRTPSLARGSPRRPC